MIKRTFDYLFVRELFNGVSCICSSCPDEELLPSDQYESLWTDFLASLQTENDPQQDEQQKSIVTTTTEDDDIDDDPEFRLPDTDYDLEDDLGDELHVSSKLSIHCDVLSMIDCMIILERELALLLEDNASIFTTEQFPNPDSVSSTTTTISSTIPKTVEFNLTSDQRTILQYQLSAVSIDHSSYKNDHHSSRLVYSIINTIYSPTT